jgi:hypothetical protein
VHIMNFIYNEISYDQKTLYIMNFGDITWES